MDLLPGTRLVGKTRESLSSSGIFLGVWTKLIVNTGSPHQRKLIYLPELKIGPSPVILLAQNGRNDSVKPIPNTCNADYYEYHHPCSLLQRNEQLDSQSRKTLTITIIITMLNERLDRQSQKKKGYLRMMWSKVTTHWGGFQHSVFQMRRKHENANDLALPMRQWGCVFFLQVMKRTWS